MIRLTLTTLAASLLAAPLMAQTELRVALDWTPNTNHVGLYVAEAEGFYDEAGLDVEILPYTDTSAGTLIANGVAQFGILSSLSLFTQGTAGADLKATYAVVQHETGRLVFDGRREDIRTPADLDGKIYAGFGSNWEEALISSMIRAAGGEGRFETVTLGTSAYEALANGRVDFTLEVSTWEGVNSVLLDRPQTAFAYADYGVPDQHTTLIGGQGAWLASHEAEATAFMEATRRGYAFAADHPEEAAQILIDATAGMLSNPELIRASMEELVAGHYLRAEDGTIGVMDPEKMRALGGFLFDHGMLRDDAGQPLTQAPDYDAFYTNAYLGAE
ncbi:ABC transporter substrate-binding protein [Pseudooceanicola sp. 502str34]